jgi:hypothetical protein
LEEKMAESAVTEEELARARKWLTKIKANTSATEVWVKWVSEYCALYARQEREAERERIAVENETVETNLADYAKRFFRLFDQYRGAWLREMGGVIRPKWWEIDGFVLRMRDIYEKAQLVDRMKQIMVKKLEEKCSAEELFDAVFEMLAKDGHDKVPTN